MLTITCTLLSTEDTQTMHANILDWDITSECTSTHTYTEDITLSMLTPCYLLKITLLRMQSFIAIYDDTIEDTHTLLFTEDCRVLSSVDVWVSSIVLSSVESKVRMSSMLSSVDSKAWMSSIVLSSVDSKVWRTVFNIEDTHTLLFPKDSTIGEPHTLLSTEDNTIEDAHTLLSTDWRCSHLAIYWK